MHHTKDKGDIALMKTTLDLTMKGFNIFLPISEHLPFDFIAYKDGKCFRMQAKYSASGNVNNTTYSGSGKKITTKKMILIITQCTSQKLINVFIPQLNTLVLILDLLNVIQLPHFIGMKIF